MFSENRAVFEIMWINIVDSDRRKMTQYGAEKLLFPCRMNINTKPYLILIAFPRQQWLRERVSVLEYIKRTLPVFFITHAVVNQF
jgi:hypothetical protein